MRVHQSCATVLVAVAAVFAMSGCDHPFQPTAAPNPAVELAVEGVDEATAARLHIVTGHLLAELESGRLKLTPVRAADAGEVRRLQLTAVSAAEALQADPATQRRIAAATSQLQALMAKR
jgi:hypothetical protein